METLRMVARLKQFIREMVVRFAQRGVLRRLLLLLYHAGAYLSAVVLS